MPNTYKQRTRVDDPAVLARYLPSTVANYLLEADGGLAPAAKLDAHIARLQELLQTVISYIPNHVGPIAAANPVSRIGHVGSVPSSLLSADLSGFTAFSSRLSALGVEGAELVANTISRLFSTLFDVLDHWGGSLLKLSGDALTTLFSGPDHQRRAVAAALEIQARMDAFHNLKTPVGAFALHMRIGVASGDVLLAEVGTPDRVELLVAGQTARRAVAIQAQAAPGAVVVDTNVYRALAPGSQALTVAAGVYRVLASEPPPAPVAPPAINWVLRSDRAWELHALVARLEALRPYLVDQHLARLATEAPALMGEGDLRPVTVLFAHLDDAGPRLERAVAREAAGEWNLADQRRGTPRVGKQAIDRVQASVQRIWEIVARFGGTINKLDLHPDGHTLVVLFGAPVAQGRDAERAVSCALALLQEAGATRAGEPLAVQRIGISTGQVFAGAVGSPERREYTVMGSVVNLAARLMQIAGPGQALLGSATVAGIQRRFELLALPPAPIKGYDELIPLYEAVSEQPGALSMLLHERGPLLGRRAELAAAQRAVREALAGRGALVELVGEAGIGKSRLLAEIVRTALGDAAQTGSQGPALALVQPHVHSRGRPYAIVADVLRRLYELPSQPDAAAQAVAAHVYERTPAQGRFLPLLQGLLGLPAIENTITQALSPDERRARLHELVVLLIASYTRTRPTALVLEDLHWADAASIDVLSELAAAGQALPLALLCTTRPDDAPQWAQSAGPVRIVVERLPIEQSQALLRERLEGVVLDEKVCTAVLERTQGNPFFIEETARALSERGAEAGEAPPLPSTVQGALLARLDRLRGEERYLLQLASVVGPLVPQALLDALARDQLAVPQTLERLIERGLLRQETIGERYAFTHSLTQETAYESLLFAQRRELHRRVADQLRIVDPEQADEEPGLLAFHYLRAEAWEPALEFAWRAGARAQALYAGDLALSHYRQALDAADRVDGDSAKRSRPAILHSCGAIHALAGRYAEAVDAFAAALAAAGDEQQRVEILIAWADVCEQQAAYGEALALLDQASAELASCPDNPLALRVQVRRGWVLIRQGSTAEAHAAVEPCLDKLEQHEQWVDLLQAYKVFAQIALDQCRWSEARAYWRLAFNCAERAGEIREIARIHNNMSVVLVQEGELSQAAQASERAIRVVEEIGDRYLLALFEGNAGVIYYKLGDFTAALDAYNDSLAIAIEIDNQSLESSTRSNLGEIERQLGRLPESVEQLTRSIVLCRQMDDDLGLSEAYRQLAETYIALGQLGEAADMCELAHTHALAAGDVQAEAIAYRVRGMLAGAYGNEISALDASLNSIRLLTDLGSAHELGQSMVVHGTILLHMQRRNEARGFFEEAIRLLRKAGAAADQAQAEYLLASLYGSVELEEIHL
jgi:class 3 adenylate cyclase/predicted ATPase